MAFRECTFCGKQEMGSRQHRLGLSGGVLDTLTYPLSMLKGQAVPLRKPAVGWEAQVLLNREKLGKGRNLLLSVSS